MAADLLRQFAVGGATRPDSFTGLNPQFVSALAQMFQAAPPEIQAGLRISSGYRSPERQAQLWDQALAKYGSPEAARKWVAPPGRSQHNHGFAVDLHFATPAAREWAHKQAGQFGLTFPLKNEAWHIELAGARGAPKVLPTEAGGPAQPTTMAQSFANPALTPVPVTPEALVVASELADLFTAPLRQQQQAEEERKAAEAQRKAALYATLGRQFG